MLPTLELEAKRKAYLFGLLEAVGRRLSASNVRFCRAVRDA
jgi:hypothetical protein